MARYAWVLEVRPGYEKEYKRRHDEIWPEMLDALRSAGIRNYSIFRHGLTLFGYFETAPGATRPPSRRSRRWRSCPPPRPATRTP